MRQLTVVEVEDKKNELVEKLSTQYSLNRISLEEYERLVKYSQDIETDKELTIFEKIINEHDLAETKSTDTDDDIREYSDKDYQNNITILSSRKTSGTLAGGNFTTILGDHKIIINENDLIKDKTVLNIMVLLGDMKIQVPEDVNVIVKAFPLLSEIRVADSLHNKNSKKKLIIKGNVILGDVIIKPI